MENPETMILSMFCGPHPLLLHESNNLHTTWTVTSLSSNCSCQTRSWIMLSSSTKDLWFHETYLEAIMFKLIWKNQGKYTETFPKYYDSAYNGIEVLLN